MRLTKEAPEITDEFTLEQFDTVYCDGCCPDCGSPLLAGPRGGGAWNVLCSNRACRQEFNIDECGFTIDRNGKANDERARMFSGIIKGSDGERRAPQPSRLKRLLTWIGLVRK